MNDRFSKRPYMLIEMMESGLPKPGQSMFREDATTGKSETKPAPQKEVSRAIPIPQMVPVVTWNEKWEPVTVWVEKFDV